MPATPHFPLLGEPISLDLVNTRVRRDGIAVDLLDSPTALAAWLAAESRRLAWSGRVTAEDVRAVRALRDAIAALLAARRARTKPARHAMHAVNAAASKPTPRLVWTTTGPQTRRRPASRERDALLRALAADAIAILTGPDAKLVRTCEHPECVLQFLAVNRRRRWCSASTCGNRARVARHYARYHASS